jgi:hypothetical protein
MSKFETKAKNLGAQVEQLNNTKTERAPLLTV